MTNAASKKTPAPASLDKEGEAYQNLINDVRPHRLQEWESVFHQAQIPATLPDVHSVLEFGPGRGLLGAMLKHYGIDYKSADVADFGARPDFMDSIQSFAQPGTYDLVCAFQALEHNPPEEFVPHLEKMASLSNKYVYISLPYNRRWLSAQIAINLPKINKWFHLGLNFPRLFEKPRPLDQYRKSENPYRHHWFEVGEKGFSEKDIEKMGESIRLKTVKSFSVKSFPYHYFILFEKQA